MIWNDINTNIETLVNNNDINKNLSYPEIYAGIQLCILSFDELDLGILYKLTTLTKYIQRSPGNYCNIPIESSVHRQDGLFYSKSIGFHYRKQI